MKLMLQLQLFPNDDVAPKLQTTIERFNEAADWLAGEAFATRLANKVELQRKHYRELRDSFGLSAQMAVRCIAQVCEADKRDKTKRPKFRKHTAMSFDQRMMMTSKSKFNCDVGRRSQPLGSCHGEIRIVRNPRFPILLPRMPCTQDRPPSKGWIKNRKPLRAPSVPASTGRRFSKFTEF
ncbi:hypothetical protein BH23PLA1_BH23PLA1_41300 [soil metagenome]